MIKNEFFCRNYYLLTGLLMFLAFPSFDFFLFKGFPFFAWIFMIPLFIYVKDRPLKQVYISAFLAGLLGHFLSLQWIGNFAGSAEGYALITGLLIPVMAVFFAFKIFLAEALSKRLPSWRFLIHPSVWCFVDWIQSLGYLAFPWINVAHSQYPIAPFVQAASVLGVPGLNFIMILTSYSLSELSACGLHAKGHGIDFKNSSVFKRTAFILCGVLVMHLWGLGIFLNAPEAQKQDLRAGVTQTCIDPWKDWDENSMDYIENLEKHTDTILPQKPNLLIWSESSTLEPISYMWQRGKENEFVSELLAYVKNRGVPLFTGEVGVAVRNFRGRKMYMPMNDCVLINGEGEPGDTYSKINLVPFGEWFPYADVPYIGEYISDLALNLGASAFAPGTEPKLFYINGVPFAPLICYEGIFYRLCRRYKQMGAELFINITNDYWSASFGGHMQHFAASVFRAAENGVWLIRVGNSGLSAFIDPYGRVTASMPIMEQGAFCGDVDFDLNRSTIYTTAGAYIQGALLGSTLLFFSAALFSYIRERRIFSGRRQ